MKEGRRRRYAERMATGFWAMCLSIVVFFVIYRYQGIEGGIENFFSELAPLFYGIFLTCLLSPGCDWIEKRCNHFLPRKLSRLLAVGGNILLVLLLVYGFFALVTPSAIRSILVLYWKVLPTVQRMVLGMEERVADYPLASTLIDIGYQEFSAEFSDLMRQILSPSLKLLVGVVGEPLWKILLLVKDWILGFVFSMFLLMRREKVLAVWRLLVYSIFPKRWAKVIVQEAAYATKIMLGFFGGTITDSFLMGALCYLGVTILSIPNAALVSIIVGITNLVPILGSVFGGLLSALLISIVSPHKAIEFLIFILILQQVDGKMIAPRIIGESTGISSFGVLFSLLFFGGMWGISGMVVGLPLFAILSDVVRRLLGRHLRQQREHLPPELLKGTALLPERDKKESN